MKKGDKVGVISNFHTKDAAFTRGKNVTIGKDISLEDANEAAVAGRLSVPVDEAAIAEADKAAKAEAKKVAAAEAKAKKDAEAKAKK